MGSIYNYRTVMRGAVMPPKREAKVVIEGTPAERWAKFQETVAGERLKAKEKGKQDRILTDTGEPSGVCLGHGRGRGRGATQTNQVWWAIRGKGEITRAEIQELVPNLTLGQITDGLRNLKKRGDAVLVRTIRSQSGSVAYWKVTEQGNADD